MLRKYVVVLLAVALFAALATTAWAANERNFIAQLSGENAGHPESPARGVTIFHLNKDGTELSYKLIVANIDNVTVAHIHLAPAPGPVVAWLYPDAPPPGTPPTSWIEGSFSGVLFEGVITEEDLIGPLAGMTLEDLLTLMRTDGAYVNVHTNDFVAPTNTGPGDFPAGEISGTIKQHGGPTD
jgi:hypothetical protein